MTRRTEGRTSTKFPRAICALAAVIVLMVGAGEASADDWVFRPSFYSHEPNPALTAVAPRPISRSAYRIPFTASGPGFAIRGGYRINRMVIQSGNSYDVTIFRQDWFEATP